ncbi:Cyrochrome P450 monooxygenase [Lachnellula suecica]|uniref:Cyrochrome P450 monooxygenase n=1 Tax=Lachnellula suecica TaxID=602035 RepID=A0A8T9C4H6_9HELO|nr:Cyrochrome P450 monooxygenase [Lachnellula suecica]
MISFSVLQANLQVHWLTGVLVNVFLWLAAILVRRLFFSPLSKFPGPKVAAATGLYEAYYDVIQEGQYTFKIKELHKKYGTKPQEGPIVRISPNELHVNDPDFYATLFSTNAPRNKFPFYVDQFALPGSGFSTIDHYHHRLRRQPLSPFFSKKSVQRLEPRISQMIEKLCSRIDEFKRSGQPVPMRLAYSCMTTDLITLYAFDAHSKHLDDKDFSPEWNKTIGSVTALGNTMKQIPWVYTMVDFLPDSVVAALSSDMARLIDWQNGLRRLVRDAIAEHDSKAEKPGVAEDGFEVERQDKNIFQSLLDSSLPAEEKTVERLRQEAQLVVGAGSDTVANVLTVTTFHLLANAEKLAKLVQELEKAMLDPKTPAKLGDVENLPYLSAVVQEGLRLAYGLCTRLQRISPDEDLQFREWSIPAGTPVGMTSVLMHHDESIYPNSYDFIPERWIDNPKLDRYLVTFSKGSRMCIGMNLARAEIYLTLATIFRRYKVELFDTIRERDIDLKYDHFLPYPSKESRGVRAIFK